MKKTNFIILIEMLLVFIISYTMEIAPLLSPGTVESAWTTPLLQMTEAVMLYATMQSAINATLFALPGTFSLSEAVTVASGMCVVGMRYEHCLPTQLITGQSTG